jgi:hypothetical protein
MTALLVASFVAVPAQAASDSGLMLHSQSARTSARSFAVQGSVTLKLGGGDVVRSSERLTLGIAAGPMLSVVDTRAVGGVRRGVANVAGFTLKPGHSASLTLVGQTLVTRYRPRSIGYDLQPRKTAPGGERLNGFGKTAAIVALAAGVVVAGILIAVNIDCNTGNGCDG